MIQDIKRKLIQNMIKFKQYKLNLLNRLQKLKFILDSNL
jgi:hypothetical protein